MIQSIAEVAIFEYYGPLKAESESTSPHSLIFLARQASQGLLDMSIEGPEVSR